MQVLEQKINPSVDQNPHSKEQFKETKSITASLMALVVALGGASKLDATIHDELAALDAPNPATLHTDNLEEFSDGTATSLASKAITTAAKNAKGVRDAMLAYSTNPDGFMEHGMSQLEANIQSQVLEQILKEKDGLQAVAKFPSLSSIEGYNDYLEESAKKFPFELLRAQEENPNWEAGVALKAHATIALVENGLIGKEYLNSYEGSELSEDQIDSFLHSCRVAVRISSSQAKLMLEILRTGNETLAEDTELLTRMIQAQPELARYSFSLLKEHENYAVLSAQLAHDMGYQDAINDSIIPRYFFFFRMGPDSANQTGSLSDDFQELLSSIEMTSEPLSEQEIVNLELAYKLGKEEFKENHDLIRELLTENASPNISGTHYDPAIRDLSRVYRHLTTLSEQGSEIADLLKDRHERIELGALISRNLYFAEQEVSVESVIGALREILLQRGKFADVDLLKDRAVVLLANSEQLDGEDYQWRFGRKALRDELTNHAGDEGSFTFFRPQEDIMSAAIKTKEAVREHIRTAPPEKGGFSFLFRGHGGPSSLYISDTGHLTYTAAEFAEDLIERYKNFPPGEEVPVDVFTFVCCHSHDFARVVDSLLPEDLPRPIFLAAAEFNQSNFSDFKHPIDTRFFQVLFNRETWTTETKRAIQEFFGFSDDEITEFEKANIDGDNQKNEEKSMTIEKLIKLFQKKERFNTNPSLFVPTGDDGRYGYTQIGAP